MRTVDPSQRTTLLDRLFMVFEALAYVVAAMIGFDWLVRRLLGRPELPDEMQRDGLAVLAGVVAVLVLLLARIAVRSWRARSRSLPRPERSSGA